MTISIYRDKFYIKLYDKRNDYDFDVISFPYLDGNRPKGQSYGIFISQLIRYARINTSFSNFISDCKKLVTKLVGQYFDVAALIKRFQVFINNHFNVWGKLGNDRNFGSADFGRFGSVRQIFCRTFCHSISCSLTIYGYKADRLYNSLQQIVFSVTAKFHNTYLDNSVLHCKTFGLLRGRILYSCFDFMVLAKLCMLRLRFFET